MDEILKNIGLRGVEVADSKVSFVDGTQGKLLYRGYTIQDLARNSSYEEVVHLLLWGRLPNKDELLEISRKIAKARPLPEKMIDMLKQWPADARPMDVFQSSLAALGAFDEDAESSNREKVSDSALRLIARAASIFVAWHHLKQGAEPPVMDDSGSHAAAILKGLWGREPTREEERLMDVLLTIHAEHTFNASTFTARQVASTFAHIYSSVSSAAGSLSGPLHGGANARVMKMLMEIGGEENIDAWVQERISSGKRVMGLGHAVYRVQDPRADLLRKVAEQALAGSPQEKWFRLGLAVEKAARKALLEQKGLDLYPNVDFYSGCVLYSMGLSIEMFPSFFGISRVAGWSAHVLEERFAEAQPKTALYRPKAHYTGRYCGPLGCKWIPLEDRGVGCPCGTEFQGCTEEEGCRQLDADMVPNEPGQAEHIPS